MDFKVDIAFDFGLASMPRSSRYMFVDVFSNLPFSLPPITVQIPFGRWPGTHQPLLPTSQSVTTMWMVVFWPTILARLA